MKCPVCGLKCRIIASTREGEGEDEDGNLIGTHCLEAWAKCPSHGWVSPKADVRSWSPERPMDEGLTEADRATVIRGLREIMSDVCAR